MASDDNDLEDRTEEPTQHRRDEWRREGRVAQSKELTGSLVVLGIIGALFLFGGFYFAGVRQVFEQSYAGLLSYTRFDWTPVLMSQFIEFVFFSSVKIFFPVAIVAMTLGVLGSITQFGVLWTTKPLSPDPDRLNPISGAKRIFSMDGAFEFFKACLKFTVVGVLLYFSMQSSLTRVKNAWGSEPQTLLGVLASEGIWILIVVATAIFVLSAGDYAFQRFRYEQKIKMTKEEVRQDRKQTEGNPQIKARIRVLQRQVSQRRMLDAVRKADVVVTNPTHFAVALQYQRDEMAAPKVVAKGVDFMAQKIKEVAREAGVPIVENPPLARAMYKALKIGQFISRELYNAVAEVLAYVYRLKGKSEL